jgi:hypothetical protein
VRCEGGGGHPRLDVSQDCDLRKCHNVTNSCSQMTAADAKTHGRTAMCSASVLAILNGASDRLMVSLCSFGAGASPIRVAPALVQTGSNTATSALARLRPHDSHHLPAFPVPGANSGTIQQSVLHLRCQFPPVTANKRTTGYVGGSQPESEPEA